MAAKTRITLLLAIIVVVGGTGWLWRSGAEGAASFVDADRPAANVLPATTAPASEAGTGLKDAYACRGARIACEAEVLAAASLEEALWLRAHGYPSPGQMARARSFSAEQLRVQALRSGSVVDASLHAQGLLREQRHREALGVLIESFSASGNLYAIHLASDVYRNSTELKNLPLSMAYLRLAYLAGDAKAGRNLAAWFPDASPPEVASADKRAAELRAQMNPGANWPRP